jgi:hypothetical protein
VLQSRAKSRLLDNMGLHRFPAIFKILKLAGLWLLPGGSILAIIYLIYLWKNRERT